MSVRRNPLADALFFERYNENHDTDTGQFASGDGGSGGGGSSSASGKSSSSAKSSSSSKAKSETTPTKSGYEFVSPSVASHLDFGQAVEAIDSDQQRSLREASAHINSELGIDATEHNIVGAWADGAENSMMDVVEKSDWEKLKLSAAMKGWLADQKQVLIFQEEDGGEAAMVNFEATGSLDDIHKNLLQDGVSFHTLVPHEGGATVYVADLDGSAADAIEKAAGRYDAEIGIEWGRAEFLGTTKQDGTDREQRDDARNLYEENVRQSKVAGSKEIWARVRDRWGQGIHEVKEGGSRAAFFVGHPADLLFRYNENHDPDNGQFASGDGGGSGGGGSSSSSSKPSASTSSKPSASSTKPSASAPSKPSASSASSPASSSAGGKKTAKVDDFVKAKVELGRFAADKQRVERFIDQWDSRVGSTPDEFKKQFLGNVDASMQINIDGGVWEINGSIKNKEGRSIGTYTRRIDWANKTAESAYFQLNGGQTDKGIGKAMLAGNVEQYKKMGIEKVRVHANIDVGGYAWAKYGYVPDRSSWSSLSSEILGKLGGEGGGGGGGYRPESWEEIGEQQQDDIRDAWKRSTRDEFVESEISNWRDNGDALDQSKGDLAEQYDVDNLRPEWAVDAVSDVIADRADGEHPVPYTQQQILAAVSVSYDTGYEGRPDPTIEFDNDKLQEPSTYSKEQLLLPGIEAIDTSAALSVEMRDEIEKALVDAFNEKAQKDSEDLDPPEYIYENISEYQNDVWDGMSERDRYRWADQNGSIEEIESDDDQSELDIDPDDADGLRELAESSDPKALWAIADSEKGKDLLLGTDWYGTLNLKDKETMDRFYAYVGKPKG